MILTVSKSLAVKMKLPALEFSEQSYPPDEEWYCRLFVAEPKTYILTTEGHSFLSVITDADEANSIEGYLNSFIDGLRKLCVRYKIEARFDEIMEKHVKTVSAKKPVNKSTLSAINDLAYHAKWNLIERERNTTIAADRINWMPSIFKGAKFPIEIFTGKKFKSPYF